MSHPFGDLLTQYRARKHGLSQARLAAAAGYDPTLIGRMCRGRRELTGPSGRERVVRIIRALHDFGVITTLDEANALLEVASMPPLYERRPAEAEVIRLFPVSVSPAPIGYPNNQTASQISDPTSGPTSGQAARALPNNNLPVQLTSFIGREDELAAIEELIRPRRGLLSDSPPAGVRLLTLTGAGGCGKTRLAIELARRISSDPAEYPDGAWLIELATLSDAALVAQQVATMLNLREDASQPALATVSNHLRNRRLLLVLDNCEHVIDACARLAEALLQTCPHLRILATSREALNIAGETSYAVPSLAFPNARQAASAVTAESLAPYSAVRLFVERAAAASPNFHLIDQNAPAAAQICRRLDGIPLAIELAAARMKALSVEQIAARLDDGFNLLTVGSRTALPRQQTLRATIDWSYDLLPDSERLLFRRLSVFAGSFTLDAAEAVCGCADSSSPNIASPDVASPASSDSAQSILNDLTQLVNKSLVVAEEKEVETKYRLLETIRQYGRQKLIDSGEADRIHARHLAFYLALAEEAEPQLRTSQQVTWLDRLEAEHDNLRVALKWSLNQRQIEAALRMAGALSRFWYFRGYWSEGRDWLDRALKDETSKSHPAARAKALYGAGWLADESGLEAPLYEESLALCRQIGDKWGAAFSLRGLGVWASMRGDKPRARTLLNESQALFHEIGDAWGFAIALFTLGWLETHTDNRDRMESLLEESLGLFRDIGDRWGMAVALNALGYVARVRGDYKRAIKLQKESFALFKELGDKAGMAISLSRLGLVAYRRDDFKQMAELFEESVALQSELGYRTDLAYSRIMLGLAISYQGDFDRAASLLQEGLTMARETGDEWTIAEALDSLAWVAYCQSNHEQAAALSEESLPLYRKDQDRSGMASALNTLGYVALHNEEFPRAIEMFEQSLALCREAGDKPGIAAALNGQGLVAHAQGDHERAEALLIESLMLRREIGSKLGMAESLEGLARVAGAEGTGAQRDPQRVVRLLSLADAIREAIDVPLPPVERAVSDRLVAAARSQLGESAFTAAWSAGHAEGHTIEQSIEQAMAAA